ncbi:MAG: hypothetical protein ACM3ZQ_07570, partial [Bacillota bacterium]
TLTPSTIHQPLGKSIGPFAVHSLPKQRRSGSSPMSGVCQDNQQRFKKSSLSPFFKLFGWG